MNLSRTLALFAFVAACGGLNGYTSTLKPGEDPDSTDTDVSVDGEDSDDTDVVWDTAIDEGGAGGGSPGGGAGGGTPGGGTPGGGTPGGGTPGGGTPGGTTDSGDPWVPGDSGTPGTPPDTSSWGGDTGLVNPPTDTSF